MRFKKDYRFRFVRGGLLIKGSKVIGREELPVEGWKVIGKKELPVGGWG